MKTIKRLWFSNERIFIETATGEILSQPLRFFIRLQKASDLQRERWTESISGIHWREIDEDISFESFTWADDDPLTLYARN